MPDEARRSFETRPASAEEEAQALRARVRAGELSLRALRVAAYYGHPAAELAAQTHAAPEPPADLSPEGQAAWTRLHQTPLRLELTDEERRRIQLADAHARLSEALPDPNPRWPKHALRSSVRRLGESVLERVQACRSQGERPQISHDEVHAVGEVFAESPANERELAIVRCSRELAGYGFWRPQEVDAAVVRRDVCPWLLGLEGPHHPAGNS